MVRGYEFPRDQECCPTEFVIVSLFLTSINFEHSLYFMFLQLTGEALDSRQQKGTAGEDLRDRVAGGAQAIWIICLCFLPNRAMKELLVSTGSPCHHSLIRGKKYTVMELWRTDPRVSLPLCCAWKQDQSTCCMHMETQTH